MADQVNFNRTWTLGDPLGEGGFGEVYAATSGDETAAVKLVPKEPGAEREMLFVDLDDVRNVVPVIDSGETDTHWGIVMPLASQTLRQAMDSPVGRMSQGEVVAVLKDVVAALEDLDERVVHRDIKPENVLLLDGSWCLADFGIARYAEATTAEETRKFALTAAYAAPERWRQERATGAADVYSLGVMAFEMLAGHLPFPGPTMEDFREQHLHERPAELEQAVPPALASLVGECLYKAAGARPAAANIAARLDSGIGSSSLEGLAALATVNRTEVDRVAEEARRASQAQSAAAQRAELSEAALAAFDELSSSLSGRIVAAAPSADLVVVGRGWELTLGDAILSIEAPSPVSRDAFQRTSPIDVILECELRLSKPPSSSGNEGRGHSLWFADPIEAGRYAWFETAFMVSALTGMSSRLEPFALAPGRDAGQALSAAMHTVQVAWPFTELNATSLEEFVDRWAGWLARAASGGYAVLSMPERSVGSWRR